MVENKKISKVLNMPLKKGIKQLFGLNTIHFSKMQIQYKLLKNKYLEGLLL